MPKQDEKLTKVLECSDAIVRVCETRFPENPKQAIAATACALGRMCEHWGVDLEQALVLAKVVSADAPTPAPEEKKETAAP